MFGSANPFGQSSTSPCGSQSSVFGQTNTSSSPFTPKPFGSTAPFGSQTGSSICGATSTSVSGAAQFSSPFSMTLGASSSSPAFGSSVPAFGLFSTPAFGSSSSSFGVFGQKPVFELFGSTPTQTSPFGSATQPSQPAFTSTPAFGVTSAPAFEATSTPAFGSTSSPTFGSIGSVFGMPSAPAFGGVGTFGASSTPLFVSSSMSAFGTSGTSFVASTAPAFVSSFTPLFRFGIPTHAFDQSTSVFGGSSPFGSTASPFGIQSSPFGSQTPTLTFGSTAIGQSGFGGQRAGSRVANYTPTTEVDGGTSGQTAKLKSISAMPIYEDKSHEELRWEDYQLGDKGSQTPTSTFGSTAIVQSGFGGLRGGSGVAIYTPTTEVDGGTSGQTSMLESISAMPIYEDKSHEELRWEDYQLGNKGSQTPTSIFGSTAIVQSGFGGLRGGSRVAIYRPTTEVDGGTSGQTSMLESISAMPIYEDKSHEKLRWEDYQLGDKGSQTPTSTFGSTAIVQSGFGGLRGGSRVAIYRPTTEVDGGTSGQTSMLESISAMPIYEDKGHEELRWEDYQLGDKGGPVPSAQSTGLVGFSSSTTQTFTFAPSPVFGQSSANPFSTSTPSNSNPFAPKTSTLTTGFGTSAAPAFNSSAFVSSTSAAAPSIFGSSTSPFGANSSPSLGFGSSTSLFNSASAQGTSSPFGPSLFSNTKSSQYSFGAPTTAQPGSSLGQTTSSFNQSSLFNSPSSGLVGSIFSNSSSFTSSNLTGFGQTVPSSSTPFQPVQAAQTSATCAFSNFGQTQPVGASSYCGAPSIFSQSNFGLSASTQSSAVVQPAPIINPFGMLPALPQMSIGRVGTAPSIQYGISSMPVLDKPASFSISSLLTSRHLSPRQIPRVTTKYHSKNDGPKVPFFRDDEDTPTSPKAENLRVLITLEQWPAKACSGKALSLEDRYTPVNENENGIVKEQAQPITSEQTSNGVNEDHSLQKGDMYMTHSRHRAGEAAIMYEHGADIEAVMPKLWHSDYYTLPRIQELAAKERAEPGFCRHVKDFMVGRQGYGCIKFLGETDVRQLDLESLIKFNNREVIVYMDESKKPPVGQGLNRPAEITLLNVKCIDKKTGHQYTEGPKVEKYKELLKRRAEEQGAEFISYDPTKGEWKIKVNHFSGYKLVDEYSWDAC